jgi:DNA-3-methyladenine glycosylase
MKLPKTYYQNPDVVFLAKDLLGKVLFTQVNGQVSSGIITETEAYAGITDKASHAYGNKRTSRTETMYMDGGNAYVYLIYGMYHLFNVVTGKKDIPHAVLIRAIKPFENEDLILKRRGATIYHKKLLNGPGKLSKGLGIDQSFNKADLQGSKVWIEDQGIKFTNNSIKITPRIGIDYAEEDSLLPYRFVVEY